MIFMVKRYRNEESTSYTFGIDLTLELIRYQLNVVNKVYVHPLCNKQDSKFIELMNQCQRYRIPVEESAKSFNILAVKENPTVIGEFRKYFAQLNDKDHLVLVHPQDLNNLGVVIRAALGFGITNIAIIINKIKPFKLILIFLLKKYLQQVLLQQRCGYNNSNH